MSLTRTLFASYLKDKYVKPNKIMLAMLATNPVLGLMKKDTSLGGDYWRVPITHTAPQGRSATYATAKTNAVGSGTKKFLVDYAPNYIIAKLTGDVVDRCKGNDNALLDALDHEMKGAMATMKRDIRCNLFGNYGGARGVVGSISTVYCTLADPEDAVNFEAGMEICDAATDGTSGSLRDSGQAITLVAVNKSTGVLTADENWSEIASMAAGDYLFVAGDFGIKWSGFAGWLPATAPTSGDSFFGVDRSVAPDVLAGIRYDGSGDTLEEAFVNAGSLGALYDAEATVGVLNPVKWGQLSNSISSKRIEMLTPNDATLKGRIGYKAIMIATPAGDVPIVADPGCPVGVGYLLDMGSWTAGSVGGDLVHIIDDDGLTLRRDPDSDGWLIELKSLGNFACDNPGRNVRIGL